jgi:SAM-dependent methyltransferase
MMNLDERTVEGFGEEWARFDQSGAQTAELEATFDAYFRVFPWDRLEPNAAGFDLGCGSGRWARFVAPRVGELVCVDASAQALDVARRNLSGLANVRFVHGSVDHLPFEHGSMDFGYSLGVLHHVPDTAAGLAAAVRCLKPGAPFLLYLYYAFDNRPVWFRRLWKASDRVRRVVARMPSRRKNVAADIIAGGVYWPLARAAGLAERRFSRDVYGWPLSAYRDKSFYIMRNDALDRFGTQLEQRFTRAEIASLMEHAGLTNIRFAESVPYWCAVGYRSASR